MAQQAGSQSWMARALSGMRALQWWITSVMGDHDYDNYVRHLQVRHPGAPVPTVSEYWRDRHGAADANPSARCC